MSLGKMRLAYKDQSALWKHMATRCAVPLVSRQQYSGRKANLKAIIEQVNDGGYSPSKPHGFLSAPKQNAVARFVPVFTHVDTAVYFACMQSVDEKLAAAAVPHTFGAWQLGGARRCVEEKEALEMFGGEDSLSIPMSCYNRGAWVRNWSQFWKLLAAQHEHADENAYFALFDIANFYDSVDLRRLENAVRAESTGVQFAMNVLFHLLRTWNKGICLYSESTKGLPMDIVGDCSRLLANFYLSEFDRNFRDHVLNRGGDYMRFADDMVVKGASEQICKDLVFVASEALHRLGLNINVAKVRYMSKERFNKYWGFVIMDRFESGRVSEAMTLLKDFISHDEFGRKPTALKRAITLVSKSEDDSMKWWKAWVRDTALHEAVPLQLSREQLLSFIRLYDDPNTAIQQLSPIFLDQPFTQPKAIFLRAIEDLLAAVNIKNEDTNRRGSDGLNEARQQVWSQISALRDPVLDLCLGTFPSTGARV